MNAAVEDAALVPSATPFLKWAGGKRRLYSTIRRHFPARYGRYWEPCLGGGAVFFGATPSRAVLSDINAELITAYQAVRDRVGDVIAELHALEPASRERYYEVRRWNWRELPPARACARLLFLNRNGFNGLYRVNRGGQFNVPFGGASRPVAEATLRSSSTELRRARIDAANVFDILADAKRGDFVYLDPPYAPRSRTASFTSYAEAPFGDAEQRRLAKQVGELAARGVQVLTSNSDTPFVRELYSGFRLIECRARRSINCNAKRRGPVGELLVRSY